MTLPAVTEDWDLSAIGLKIHDPDLPYERFAELCWTLGKMHEAVRFAIGDAILQGEALYGQIVYQAVEEMQLSEEARREYVRVASRVPRSRRRKDLSWSHHRAVAALEPEEQEKKLKQAARENLSHHEFRDVLRNRALPKVSTLCRCCHRPL